MRTRSTDITISTELEVSCYSSTARGLWNELRKTSVDAMQASSPDLQSFVDECLHFAYIYENHNQSEPIRLTDAEPLKGMGAEVPCFHNPCITTCSVYRNHNQFVMSSEGRWEQFSALSAQEQPRYQTQYGTLPSKAPVGIVYLKAGLSNVPAGEINIGAIISHDNRRRGYARQAIELLLSWSFDELKFHRVQAAIPDTMNKEEALMLFASLGFQHEGIRRRSIYVMPGDEIGEGWRDATYLAMLDTYWVLKGQTKNLPRTLWDELLARHTREREDLIIWEDTRRRLRRTGSNETIRRSDGKGKEKEDSVTLGVPLFARKSTLMMDTMPSCNSASSQSSSYGSVPSSPRDSSTDISERGFFPAEDILRWRCQSPRPVIDEFSIDGIDWSRWTSPNAASQISSRSSSPTIPPDSFPHSPASIHTPSSPPMSQSPSVLVTESDIEWDRHGHSPEGSGNEWDMMDDDSSSSSYQSSLSSLRSLD